MGIGPATLVALLLVIGTAGAAGAQQSPAVPACSCPSPDDPDDPGGVVWRGSGVMPTLPEIARRIAPALWFSSDEPLLVRGDRSRVPGSHACDQPSSVPIVYYQVLGLVLSGEERVDDPDTDPRFFEKVDRFLLKFYYYYDQDIGVGAHKHDLESIEVEVVLSHGAVCSEIRMERVEATAHGVRWYSNVLKIERDTVLPLTILVEEGKHASCPDRNGDGIYTPGYDVNVRVHDAWGVRDVMGSGVMMGTDYVSSMTKPRSPAFRLNPPPSADACFGARTGSALTSAVSGLGTYELRSTSQVEACTVDDPAGRLREMMEYHRFGEAPEQRETEVGLALTSPESVTRLISGVNVRLESSQVGLAVQGPGIELPQLWLVPRVTVVGRNVSVEALITQTASRWASWYMSGGYASDRREAERNGGFVGELGWKFRLTAQGKLRWAMFGYSFAGVRIGIRASGFSSLVNPRAIVEIGAGAF